MSRVYSIVFQPEPSQHEEPYRYMRVPLENAQLIANHGIEGDRKAGKSRSRHLNIMSQETLKELTNQGYKTAPGEMGEQIIIEGLNVATLTKGDRIQIGETAIVEINASREGCEWFEMIQSKPKEVDLGVMATVIEGGHISLGDDVKTLPRP
jgi:MOSC domain-containing protein YiiM